ncbi:phosphoesterase, dhha1 [gamma proteobacterium HTCC5015]|nr:phosphoesterase, dhha1 [gamma proteobacterium HTCC5015]
MVHFDVFNGDADGIGSLIQLRLINPRQSSLITGVKRDIALLKHVPINAPLSVTALDISLAKNREAVDALLSAGSSIDYIDHHAFGDSLPDHPSFSAQIETAPTTCTGLLVNHRLNRRFENWAIVCAFGDNLNQVATGLAQAKGLNVLQTENLQKLGVAMNYNAYGSTIEDLHYHPADLYRKLVNYADPLDCIEDGSSVWKPLHRAYLEDMEKGLGAPVVSESETAFAVELPDEAWSRRVSGVLGNELANQSPDKAVAILSHNAQSGYTISIRAPLNNRHGASDLAGQFPTGGGRAAAAGINQLDSSDVEPFFKALHRHWSMV